MTMPLSVSKTIVDVYPFVLGVQMNGSQKAQVHCWSNTAGNTKVPGVMWIGVFRERSSHARVVCR